MSYNQKRKGRQSGISLISMVVTVVVIIILAMMTFRFTRSMPEEANYAKFSDEIKNLELAVDNLRTENASKGDTEEKINAGFRKVTLINAPDDFVSFDRGGVEITGYIVDLNTIEYDNTVYGKEFLSGVTSVEFLKDDIYVYDSTGTVYYARGIEYKDEIVHTVLAGSDMNGDSTEDGPIITNITITSGELESGIPTSGKAKVIISAFPRYGGELRLILKNIECEKLPDGTYVAQVSKNGVYTLIATEENGGRSKRNVNVTGIVEQDSAPSNLSMIVNNGERYTLNRMVDVVVRADGASKMIIAKDNPLKPAASDPRWDDYQTNFEYDLGATEKAFTLYAWFKDDFGNVTDRIVKATVVYDKTPPSKARPNVVEAGPYILIALNQADNISSNQYLLSKAEYGYRVNDGTSPLELDYTWTSENIIGPLNNRTRYDFATRTQDEAGNKSFSDHTSYTVNYDYIISFDLQGGVGDFEDKYTAAGASINLPIEVPTKIGYDFVGWSENRETLPTDIANIIINGGVYTPTGNTYEKTLYAIWKARIDTPYKVLHYTEKVGIIGDYELALTEELEGETGKLAYAFAKTDGDFEGFVENQAHVDRLVMATINADGSTVLKIFYYRGRYKLTVTGENASTTGSANDVQHGESVPVIAVPYDGYEFDKWIIEGETDDSSAYRNFENENGRLNQNASFKMLNRNTTLIAKTKIKKFTITYNLKGGNVAAQNPVEYTKETPEFILNNPTKVGYNFEGWTGTGLTQKTTTVTVNPGTLIGLSNREYEAHFTPREELLTITATPTTQTNGQVTALISCLDSSLRVEYRIGNSPVWNMYSTPIVVNENTVIYARALENGVVIDNENLAITNIDAVAPTIRKIEVAEEWNIRNDIKVIVDAIDNVEVVGYAFTKDNSEPGSDLYSTNNILTLEEGINYIWVGDAAGNIASSRIYVHDISETEDKSIFAIIYENEITIVGSGATKSYPANGTPYTDKLNDIKTIRISEGITSIGNNVLASMKNAKEIYIPSTLQEIKEDAMVYTNKYESILIASGNSHFAYQNYSLYNGNKTLLYMHSDADETTTYTIPSTVETIGKAAFYDNTKLNTLVVTSNPKLKESVFENCKSLYQVTGQIGGESIDARAFADCTNLSLIELSDTLISIGAGTFEDTQRLTVLEIPKNVQIIVNDETSQNGVFKNIGIDGGGSNAQGIVKYYQSCDAMIEYARKYSAEADFVLIDDVPPELISLSITSPSSGTYSKNAIIEIVAEFDERINLDYELPKLTIKIGNAQAKIVENASGDNNLIRYRYVVTEQDEGALTLVSYQGSVRDMSDNITNINETTITGSQIYLKTGVEMIEDSVTTYHPSLQDAVDAAKINNGTTSKIKILKNLNEKTNIPVNKNVEIEMNYRTINYSGNEPAITNNAILTITGEGSITSNGGVAVLNEGIMKTNNAIINVVLDNANITGIKTKGSLEIANTVINVNSSNGETVGIAVETQGNAKLKDSTINSISTNASGYGVKNSGDLEMGNSSDEVSNTTPSVYGSEYGYYSTSGTLSYYDGTFEGLEGKALVGTVTNMPESSYIKYIKEAGREKTQVRVDRDKPTNVTLTASTTEWTKEPIILTGSAVDVESGISHYVISNSANMPTEGEWIALDEPENYFDITMTVRESKTYCLHVKDQVGNYEKSDIVITKFDDALPVFESLTVTPSGWTNQNVVITFVATDATSGISKYEYSTTYHDTNIPGEGAITLTPSRRRIEETIERDNGVIYIYIYDEAGNGAYRRIDINNVDKENPIINVQFDGYEGENAKFTITATDAQSGIDAILKNNVEILSTNITSGKSATDSITTTGTTTYKAVDMAGNEASEVVETTSIEYNSNNGTGEKITHIKVKNENRTIATNLFVRSEYEFVRWDTMADGTGTEYMPGDEYAANTNLVLYAIWRDNVPPEINDIELSESWIEGTTPTLTIHATDNIGVTGYAITTSANVPTTWSEDSNINVTMGAAKYYAWVKDAGGNTSSIEFKMIDLSEDTAPNTVFGIIKHENENDLILSIEGNGSIKDSSTIGETFGADAENIKTVIIDTNIVGIGSKALAGLTNADTISIPHTVERIEIDAFTHTNNYTSIFNNSASFKVENGVLISIDNKKVYISSTNATAGTVTLTSSIQEIAPYAFEESRLTGIVIPENINISEGTFYNAHNIQINAPNGIGGTSIGAKAFYGASKVTGITISKNVTNIDGTEVFVGIGTNAGTDTGKGYVYYYESCDAMLEYATNAATREQATFIGIDDVKPIVESVLINNGDEATTENVVTLEITATDNHTVEKMFITEDETIRPTADNVTWINYQTEIDVTLSNNDGNKNIYVWVKDDSGNISEIYGTDSIWYVYVEFELTGDQTIIQYVDTTGKDYYEYRERGYTVSGQNINVNVTGSVNHEVAGTYEIDYEVTSNGMHLKTITRNVEIIPNTWNTIVSTNGNFQYVTHQTGEYVKIVGCTNINGTTLLEIPNTINVGGTEYRVIDVGDGVNPIAVSNSTVIRVTLPKNVIAVSNNAFSTFTQLEEIEYSENMMTIGENAFANSNGTHYQVLIKENLREVKRNAFKNTNVSSIVIENGAKAIYEDAFYKNNSESTGYALIIPESIDYIGPQAFYGMRIDYIDVAVNNANYDDFDQLALTSKDGTKIYQYAINAENTYMILDNIVTEIEKGAFAEAEELQEITIPSGVIQIKEETFKSTGLIKVYLPATIGQIEREAFSNCSALTEVIIDGAPSISGSTFKNSNQLKYVLVFDDTNIINLTSALEIGNLANVYVTSEAIENVYETNANWSQLGNDRIHCIARLKGASRVELENGASYIEEGIYLLDENVMNGTSTKVAGLGNTISSNLNENVNGTYTITYTVDYSGDTVCTVTREIIVKDTLPPEITNIETDASWVEGTTLKLKITAIDNYDTNLEYTVTSSENIAGATWNTSNVVEVTAGTKYISVKDSSGNITTKEIKIWDISKNSNKHAFAYMPETTKLVFTGSGETKDYTGYDNTPWNAERLNITQVLIEEGINDLGEFIVAGLENLVTLTIPNSIANVNNVATTAFARTNNYETINISATNTALYVDANGTMYSRDGERIFLHTRRDTSTNLTIGANVKYISDSAFYMNNNLNEITFNSKVDLENSAFENCMNLSTINGTIGNTTIGNKAFMNCTLLENIIISKTVTTLGTQIFMGVPGIVYYYASCNAMRTYETSYPYETNYEVIDDIGATTDRPTLRASSAIIIATSNQVNEYSTITRVEYNWKKVGENYNETRWQENSIITGLDADTEYAVITRVTDSSNNVVVSEEATIRTEKVPEEIEISASITTPTNGNVDVIVMWPIEDMERLYGNGWPAGTTVIKQVGTKTANNSEITWRNITNQDTTHTETVTENNTTVYARLFDGHNYTAQTISLTVVNIDRVAPTGTVIINGGASETYNPIVTLTLNATDDRNEIGYGVKYYYASENQNVNLGNVTWNPYTGNGDYTFELVSENAEKTIYVWYKDAAGNISSLSSDSISLVISAVKLETNGTVSYYDSINEALDNVELEPNSRKYVGTITLLKHIQIVEEISVSTTHDILLNMNGKNISCTDDSVFSAIWNSGTLTIINDNPVKSTISVLKTNGDAIGIDNYGGLLDITGVSVNAISTNGVATGINNRIYTVY